MVYLKEVWKWISNNAWWIGLIIQGIIAYHVFFLSKVLSKRAKLEHQGAVKRKTEKLISKIQREGLNSKVHLVNTLRYPKGYESIKRSFLKGYPEIAAEIKSTRYDGVQFFEAMPRAVYRDKKGRLTFKEKKNKKEFNVYPVGVVPYEWIDYIDPEGDEYSYNPLFYCRFRWRFFLCSNPLKWFARWPYKRSVFYKFSTTYQEGEDPHDMKYVIVREKIHKK